jgi:hypothetical protein
MVSNVLPKPIPALNAEQWATVEKEMKRKPSKKDAERLKRVKKTFKNCPL